MPSKNSKKPSVEKKISQLSQILEDYQPQLSEIRRIFTQTLIFFVVGCLFGLLLNRQIILYIISLFDLERVNIVLTSPYQFVNLAISISAIFGFIFATPIFIFHLLNFIRPALRHNEFEFIKKLIPSSILLFVAGLIFGAKIEQFVVSLYSQTTQEYSLNNFWDVESFLTQFVIMSFTMGVVFQLPILLSVLIKTKVITTKILAQQRKYVYTALLIFGVLLPPSDVLSLILIITPLFLLFEGTLLLNRDN